MLPYEGASRMTDSRPPRVSAGTRLGTGIVLVLLALVCFGASRLAAHSQRHAYSRGATPPPTYRLNAGTVYQLSAAKGVEGLTKDGVISAGTKPSCFWSSNGGVENPVTVVSTKDDPRDLHVFETFKVPSSGEFHISCRGISDVFVDDAENSSHDLSGLLVLLSLLIGVVGFAATLSGGYTLQDERGVGDDEVHRSRGSHRR
jgi:hypothetical protein